MTPDIDYLPDDCVDDAIDQEIRTLLTTCFTKPQDIVFEERRYFQEPYPHRWIIRNPDGALVAHVGVHEKEIRAGDQTYRVGGIAEVCVHPDYRGKGYVRSMLSCIHAWLREREYPFAALFGRPLVYGSSGYVKVDNLMHGGDEDGWRQAHALVCVLGHHPWPAGTVYMPGPGF